MKQFIANKKPIQICIGFLFILQYSIAQSNLAYTQQLFKNRDLGSARESVDSFVMLNRTDIEGWLTKAEIYNAISKDPVVRSLSADAGMEAFQSLKKAVALNMQPEDNQIKARFYTIALDLYNTYTGEGLKLFNAGVAQNNAGNFIQALFRFKNAGSIGRYRFENNWGINELDTLNLYYTALSAIYSDKEEDAVFYSKLIIDKIIIKYPQLSSYEKIYQWLAYYYKIKEDHHNFFEYNSKGLNSFPTSTYFTLLYIDWYRKTKDYPNLFKQYDRILNKYASNAKYRLAYYMDLYDYLYESKTSPEEREIFQSKLFKGLTAFLQLYPGNSTANLLIGKYYINQATEIAQEMAKRSTTDPVIMNEYKSRVAGKLKKSNSYLLAIIKINKISPTKNYIETLQLLISNFRILNMPKEVRNYQAILTATSITLGNLLILILLLLNIILIIGIKLLLYSIFAIFATYIILPVLYIPLFMQLITTQSLFLPKWKIIQHK